MVLVSCIEEPESPQIELADTSEIAQVKAWFEENKTNLRLPERGSNFRTESQELILPFFEKEPDWDQFHHYYFPDGREVFEISLENENIYIPVEKESGGVKEGVEFFQNILFVKHPSEPRFDPMIIRYYPEETSSNRDFKEISYRMIDEKWSGWIDLFTYDEHYVMGYKVDQGRLTHTRTIQKEMENGRKSTIGMENMDVSIKCYEVATEWYDGRTLEKLDTTYSTTCEIENGGGFLDGGGISGGTYSGGGEGDCISCYDPPKLPDPNLKIEMDESIKGNPYLKCIVDKLQLANFVNELALFDGTMENGRNVILKVGETVNSQANAETSDDLGPYRIEITINQDKLNRNSLEMARSILHELIHAELFIAIFHKNGSPLDRNFEANFLKYVELYKNDSDIPHNYMAENMVNKMASVLSQIHSSLGKESFINNPDVRAAFPKGLPSDFYHGIAWSGLKWTDKWRYDLPGRDSYENYQDLAERYLNKECN